MRTVPSLCAVPPPRSCRLLGSSVSEKMLSIEPLRRDQNFTAKTVASLYMTHPARTCSPSPRGTWAEGHNTAALRLDEGEQVITQLAGSNRHIFFFPIMKPRTKAAHIYAAQHAVAAATKRLLPGRPLPLAKYCQHNWDTCPKMPIPNSACRHEATNESRQSKTSRTPAESRPRPPAGAAGEN